MSTLNRLKKSIETAPLFPMETYLKNLRTSSAWVALIFLATGIALHATRGPYVTGYLFGHYVILAGVYWALARFGRFATADANARDRIAGTDDFSRRLLVDQIHAAHMLLISGTLLSAAAAAMSPYRWVPALLLTVASAGVEMAIWRRRQTVVG